MFASRKITTEMMKMFLCRIEFFCGAELGDARRIQNNRIVGLLILINREHVFFIRIKKKIICPNLYSSMALWM